MYANVDNPIGRENNNRGEKGPVTGAVTLGGGMIVMGSRIQAGQVRK